MSRIRSVHPGLFTDEAFVALSDAAKVFFIGLWTEADDYGVFEWKPVTLKIKLLAGSTSMAEPLLEELVAADRIRRYEMNGRHFGVIHNFSKYQRPRRPTAFHPMPIDQYGFAGRSIPENQRGRGNRIPTMSGIDEPKAPSNQPDSRQKRESPEQMKDEGWRMKGEGRGSHNKPTKESQYPRPRARQAGAPSGARDDDVDFEREFEELWRLFPRKLNRNRASAAYRLARRKATLAVIRGGLERFAAASAGKAAKYVTGPENWLNDERWLDEPDDGRIPGAANGTNGEDDYAYAPESEEHFRDRCRLWFDETRGGPIRERWPVDVWGPVPGERGCRCPEKVLAEFGWKR